MSLRLAVLVVGVLSSSAFAQTIYAPVTVQYGGQNPYYYAGSEPIVHQAAKFPHVEGTSWGRTQGYAFVSPTRAVTERRARIFTDAFGTVDAAPYGLTVDEVVNEANARLPRYFRKADLASAGAFEGRYRLVPPTAAGPTVQPRGTIIIRPSTPGLHRRTPVFVFPKELLERKMSDLTINRTRQA